MFTRGIKLIRGTRKNKIKKITFFLYSTQTLLTCACLGVPNQPGPKLDI